MDGSLLKLGIIGAASAGFLFAYSHLMPFLKAQPSISALVRRLSSQGGTYHEQEPQLPINQILKQIFMRVSTKQNMKIVSEMCALDCLQAEQLAKPYQYTLKTGGKKIRLIMAVIVAEMFTGHLETIPKQILQVGGLIQLLHSASLIIDDIEDGSMERRGQQCSHLVYGLDRSINAANLMYFLPFNRMLNTIQDQNKRTEILKIFFQEMTLSHMGQAQDIQVHKTKSIVQLPILDQYQFLTIAKTGSLLRMMVRMLCIFLNRTQKQSQKLCDVMNYVALAFQTTDDILNLTKNLGKGGLAEDLKEKKFTPIINFMRYNAEFIDLFVIDKKDDETIHKMLQMIFQSKVLEATKKIASRYQETAQGLINDLPTPYSKNTFKKLMKYIINREN